MTLKLAARAAVVDHLIQAGVDQIVDRYLAPRNVLARLEYSLILTQASRWRRVSPREARPTPPYPSTAPVTGDMSRLTEWFFVCRGVAGLRVRVWVDRTAAEVVWLRVEADDRRAQV